MTRPKLGTWHTIEATAYKDHLFCEYELSNTRTKWTSYPCKKQRAMFIGYRFKFNGTVILTDEDSQNGFQPDETVEVWLFVVDPRHSPIMAFPDDVQKQESEDND